MRAVAALQGAPYITVHGADKFIRSARRNFFVFEPDVFLIFQEGLFTRRNFRHESRLSSSINSDTFPNFRSCHMSPQSF
jgi:hypothetical protein